MRLVALAAILAAALVGIHLVAGGGSYAPTPVADPCAPRVRPSSGDLLDPAQRATLAVLDGAACDLGTSREQVLLDLIRRRNPLGVSDARMEKAVMAGIDRAVREKALGATEAAILRFAVRVGGVGVLLDRLRG
jgi:hypothetical protein